MNPADANILHAHIEALSEQADALEDKWGVDRLHRLVQPDLRARWATQRDKWRGALEAAYEADTVGRPLPQPTLHEVASQARRMAAAWRALDKAATEAGAQPLPVTVWEVAGTGDQEGQVIAIVRTTAEAHAVIRDGRHAAVYTMEEIANVLAALPPTIRQAKAVFPGATVMPVRRRMAEKLDDPVPW